jgi:hypothetical protein
VTRARRPAPTDLVRHQWAGRIVAEYRSAALTQATALWLLQIGASADLVRAGLRIVDDELVHAELSRRVFLAAGGSGMPLIDRATLGLSRQHATLEEDLVTEIVRIFCLGETVAVKLFANLRRGATVALARRALERILRDEVRHRDFGWTALEWLLSLHSGPDLRALVERQLGLWLRELEASYGDELDHGIVAVTPAERAWGVAPWREYAAILHRTSRTEYQRRFRKLGIVMPPARDGSRT